MASQFAPLRQDRPNYRIVLITSGISDPKKHSGIAHANEYSILDCVGGGALAATSSDYHLGIGNKRSQKRIGLCIIIFRCF